MRAASHQEKKYENTKVSVTINIKTIKIANISHKRALPVYCENLAPHASLGKNQ